MLAQAVANQAGALFMNLSAGNLEGKYSDKKEAAKFLHMVFEVARDKTNQPVVLYVDDAHKLAVNPKKKKKKKKGKGGDEGEDLSRFRKDWPTYVKSLQPDDAVLIIGCSNQPWLGEEKQYRALFDKYIYCPLPDYASRLHTWQRAIEGALRAAQSPIRAEGMDFSSLAHISAGYSVGSILKAVRATLSRRRIQRMKKRPLQESEFLGVLARCHRVFADEDKEWAGFHDAITGYKEARAKLREDAEGGDKKKKKKK